MAGFSRVGFLAVAVVFHLVYIYSIFDIYFVSPIVSGMRLYGVEREPHVKAPADRLFLFVGDGLRADKAFQYHPEPYPETQDDLTPRPLAPFLRSQILNHGTFGVSHTRVPTESRPGHVALIAGLYEDVSAVTTGWKLNPVNFDSVFNRSRHTWSWGSPDILPMFQHGAIPGRVDADHYEPEFEDFAGDATHLDLWVFNHVKHLFKAAETNATLNRALREDKVVFFLHLLGLDTTGHSYRPYSKEYLHNIKVVDQGVCEIVTMVENFYRDDRTAFIFTADHGMSDWGSHGDGHPNNTRTPLIAWGSGIAKPVTTKLAGVVASGHDEYSADWNLDHVKRHDVAQADVAALMAYLIGTEFPANSVGELPLSYLSASLAEKATAALVNTKGILEMYHVKEQQKNATEVRYQPFSGLDAAAGLSPDQRIAEIQTLIHSGKYEEAIEETAVLLKAGLQGLRYLQTYDWLFLRALITTGYLGWMAFAITTVVDLFVVEGETVTARSIPSIMFFSSILAVMYASFARSQSPATYYMYAFFPVMFWEEVYARRRSLAAGGAVLFNKVSTGSSIAMFIVKTMIYIGVVESLAVGYIHREVLTGLFLTASVWPLTLGWSFIKAHSGLLLGWFASCVVMSSFTLLPAIKIENVALIIAGGGLVICIGLLYLFFENWILAGFKKSTRPSPSPSPSPSPQTVGSRTITGIQIGLVALAMAVTRSSALSLEAKKGLPRGNQIVGWVTLVVSLLMPSAYRLAPNQHYMHRLLSMFLTCAPTFVILTISYEALFYVAFSVTLVVWVHLEHRVDEEINVEEPASPGTQTATVIATAAASNLTITKPQYRALRLSDARVALFFFVLLQSAFFSTGNVASISSFSLDSVCRLIPIFDPFSQGALLILKLMIPFALMSANLGVLNLRLGVAPSALFMLGMAVSDLLTLYFFWVVKDEGSWLEIGSTISHFVIASLLCVFVAILEGVSAMFVAGVEIEKEHGDLDVTTTVVNGDKVEGLGREIKGHGGGASEVNGDVKAKKEKSKQDRVIKQDSLIKQEEMEVEMEVEMKLEKSLLTNGFSKEKPAMNGVKMPVDNLTALNGLSEETLEELVRYTEENGLVVGRRRTRRTRRTRTRTEGGGGEEEDVKINGV